MKRSSLKRLDIITLFPSMFEGPMTESLLGRARERDLIDLRICNLRDFAPKGDRHRTVDERPYGGGAGMVLQAEPIFQALAAIRKSAKGKAKPYVVYLSPQGRVLTQAVAAEFLRQPWLVFLCGHYEGVDERIMKWIDEEISIGDYVLTGGELPAMVVAEAVIRLIPGVVKESESIANDSFQSGLLDYPHFTRPATWRGCSVPEVLLSGNHAKIEAWRRGQAQAATAKKRPDLLQASARRKRSR